jgi:hypothetical protein
LTENGHESMTIRRELGAISRADVLVLEEPPETQTGSDLDRDGATVH